MRIANSVGLVIVALYMLLVIWVMWEHFKEKF